MQRRAFALQLSAADDAVELLLVTDLAARLSDIDLPTLVVGAHHHDAPDFHTIGRPRTSQLPRARLMTLPDMTHVTNYEIPDRFNAVLRTFIEHRAKF